MIRERRNKKAKPWSSPHIKSNRPLLFTYHLGLLARERVLVPYLLLSVPEPDMTQHLVDLSGQNAREVIRVGQQAAQTGGYSFAEVVGEAQSR